MSQPDLSSANPPGVITQKPKTSIFTVLLIVSLIALMFGCLFLFLELSEYGDFWSVKGSV